MCGCEGEAVVAGAAGQDVSGAAADDDGEVGGHRGTIDGEVTSTGRVINGQQMPGAPAVAARIGAKVKDIGAAAAKLHDFHAEHICKRRVAEGESGAVGELEGVAA